MADLEKFAAASIRGPRRGVSEHLQASKLIMANRTPDPLQRIRFVAEAAWFEEQVKDDPDYQYVEVLYKVALALLGVEADKVVLAWWRGSPYQWIFRYPVPWGLPMDDQEIYERFIKPWCHSTPNHWSKYVKFHPQRIEKTKGSCSACNHIFFDVDREKAEKWKETIEERFASEIKEDRCLLVTEERYKEEREKYRQNPEYDYYNGGPVKYQPPHLKVRFFTCPECGKNIILDYETEESNYYKNCDDAIYTKKKKKLDTEYPRLKVEEYDYYPEGAFRWFFWDFSQWLTREGFKELRNQFIGWADPIATRLERKLSDLINPQVFTDLFRKAEEEEGEEKDLGNSMGPRE